MIDSDFDFELRLAALLQAGEPLAASALASALGISQPTLSRRLAAIDPYNLQVVRLGAARSSRYALGASILGLPATQALTWGGGEAMPASFGHLSYLKGDRVYVRSGKHEWLTQGKLPWFLTPLRPQGFLGRELARLRPDLPPDPERWNLAQVLHVAITHVHDPIGAFYFQGLRSERWSSPQNMANLGAHYDQLASEVGQGLPAGSSAAGEQPKFTTVHSDGRAYIVKFSPLRGTPFGERWHALLSLEHLALRTLHAHGMTVAQTQLICTAQRTYLQSRRFDREAWAMRHVVAIEAVHDEFCAFSRENWVHTAQALRQKKLITAEELSAVASIHAFGHFIGNSDMHFGNLSFSVDDVVKPKIHLAPLYDMLPMMWRPSIYGGELSDSPVREAKLPLGFAQSQESARLWAVEFWEKAARLDIGQDLQAACLESARRVATRFT